MLTLYIVLTVMGTSKHQFVLKLVRYIYYILTTIEDERSLLQFISRIKEQDLSPRTCIAIPVSFMLRVWLCLLSAPTGVDKLSICIALQVLYERLWTGPVLFR